VRRAGLSAIGSASMSARSPMTRPERACAADDADDAGAADPCDDLVAAEGAQLVGDDAGGAVHVEQQFGMLVDVASPGGGFLGEFGDTVDDRHGTSAPGQAAARGRIRPACGFRRSSPSSSYRSG
jgi:hypothetical protein